MIFHVAVVFEDGELHKSEGYKDAHTAWRVVDGIIARFPKQALSIVVVADKNVENGGGYRGQIDTLALALAEGVKAGGAGNIAK